jgi:Glycosyl transferase family 2
MDVTFVIPSIPPREALLKRAIKSIVDQSYSADHIGIIVEVDHDHAGAGPTRQRALEQVQTEWVAFLDDDDQLFHHHVQTLVDLVTQREADVGIPWFEVMGGHDPFPMHQGREFDIRDPHAFPITTLVRLGAIQAAGAHFLTPPRSEQCANEDWEFWLMLGRSGAKFASTPEVTWRWHVHGANTSGVPRW